MPVRKHKENTATRTTQRAKQILLSIELSFKRVTTAACASALLVLNAHAGASLEAEQPTSAVQDQANLFKGERAAQIESELQAVRSHQGYDVRVLAKDGLFRGRDTGASEGLTVQRNSVLVLIDPTSPNVLDFIEGSSVQAKLPPAFFIELQSRYGNLFTVRELGEADSAKRAIDALVTCLSNDAGCSVVPGVDQERLQISLALAATGGLILGSTFASGWQYSAFAAPIWVSLLYSYAVLPVYKRDSSQSLTAALIAAFAAAAAMGYALRLRLLQQSGRA